MSCGNNHVSSKGCLSDVMWMKSLCLREACGTYVSWNYSKTEPRGQAHDGKMNGKEESRGVSSFGCS